ncbi:hypothetical protein B0A48_05302 [Cryoendolithus antarcticus]|uniref:AB hydrolase-1 domain-containing protein n=1 Tax=Cryoendolithus antarcticus TaxID=1507870 RepID=A0A1V8TI40_9PEZI|nr:hypothetical protein B0A48_05302 [Cryoendolithus antarcticus]
MALDRLSPNDKRLEHKFATVQGHRWHYISCAVPSGTPQKGTVVLVHGFPDLWLAWRYQVPLLLSLGFQCIILECMGYGQTGASDDLSLYGFKAHADAIAGIAKAEGVSRIILGGHDWGGAVVYRVAQWQPELVSHVFSVATPYQPVHDKYLSNEVVAKLLPNFGYQQQFGSADGKIEAVVKGRDMTKKFLRGMYGGRLSSRRTLMVPETGVNLQAIQEDDIGPSPFFSEEELDYYTSQYCVSSPENPMKGPCNWYRTRKINFDDEKNLPAAQKNGVSQPVLFIQALQDNVLIPKMSEGMEETCPKLTRGEVKASHWALWHASGEVNDLVKNWFEAVVVGGKSKL